MNFRLIENVLGWLLLVYAAIMSIPLCCALLWDEPSTLPFLFTFTLTGITGIVLIKHGRKEGRMGIREGFTIVSGAWILASLSGALPFYLSNAVPTYLDGLFETVSGLTTTGASVIDNVEALSNSLLLWRSLTNWLGGMGIIVLFIVFLPKLGGAVHLFKAEFPGPMAEKVLPRMRDNAAKLWQIYVGFTLLQIVLLILAGMSYFDSVNHSFTTMATGGFSTKNSSIMYYNNSLIELIIIFFMILSGGSYGLYYTAWSRGLKKIWQDTEFRVYLAIITIGTLVISLSLWLIGGKEIISSLRLAFFQVASITSTTGFASADFDKWPSLAKIVLFLLMFIGGSAGSTAGGIKVARLILLIKLAWAELRRIVHPHAVISINYNGKHVDPLIINTVAVFFFLFMTIFAFATILLSATGLEPFDAICTVVASLCNIGPGFGVVGPTTTYSSINAFGEVILILCMLLGRLELFTLLVVFQPEFWRSRINW
ncbi:MAG: TrkH family potassium uptake protein [Desulfosporosinus sp.]|jgi:trk system potassium uptake protein TrkH